MKVSIVDIPVNELVVSLDETFASYGGSVEVEAEVFKRWHAAIKTFNDVQKEIRSTLVAQQRQEVRDLIEEKLGLSEVGPEVRRRDKIQ